MNVRIVMKKNNLIKSLVSLTVILCFLFTLLSFETLANNDIQVLLDGNPINFDVPPQIIDGRTMVPIRAIFEAMGAQVSWDDSTKTATAVKGDTTVIMWVNLVQLMIKNKISNKVELMDVSPVNKDGRVLAPARYVAESFGYNVEWLQDSSTVSITSSNREKNESQNVLPSEKKNLSAPEAFLILKEHLKTNSVTNFSYDNSKSNVAIYHYSGDDSIMFNLRCESVGIYDINVSITLYEKRELADIFFFLVPPSSTDYISAYGTMHKELFGNTNSSISIDYSGESIPPKGDVYAECIEINIETLKLILKIVDGFLTQSNASISVADLGFKNIDTSKISVATQERKMLSLLSEIGKKNVSPKNNNSSYYVYKGTSVPCYDDISGDNYLGVDEEYRVFSYSRSGLKKYLSFLDDLGYRHEEPYHGSSGLDFYTYYDSEYIIYIAKTTLYTNGNLIDVIKLNYTPRK